MSVTITCGKCKQTNDLSAFCRCQPDKTYRCPACGRVERIVDEKPTILPSGFIMPGKRKVVIL